MDFASLLGGGGGGARDVSGPTGIGGSGKGASGAATIFGDNARIGGDGGAQTLLILGAAVLGVGLLGFIVLKLVK